MVTVKKVGEHVLVILLFKKNWSRYVQELWNKKIWFKVIDAVEVSTLQAVRHIKCNILTEQVDIDKIAEWVFAWEFIKDNDGEHMSEAYRIFWERNKEEMLKEWGLHENRW